jgi:hypothetical protein
MDMKSNKVDTEATMRGVDVVHKQIKHLVTLVLENIRSNIQKSNETEQGKNNKRIYLL